MTRSAMLTAGGRSPAGTDPALTRAAAGSWSAAGDLPSPRQWFSPGEAAIPLENGKVLAAGGAVVRTTSTAESLLFDPIAATWAPTGDLTTPRRAHTLTKLADGRVLAVGGMPGTLRLPFEFLASAEIYDPDAEAWTPTAGGLTVGRATHSATLLGDGRVLVAGGMGYPSQGVKRTLRSAEVFDPEKKTWTLIEPMTDARQDHPAIRLPDGRVLVAGGETGVDVYQTISQSFCELYDPATDTWSPTGSMRVPRGSHQAVLLQDGTVFTMGGYYAELRRERGYVAFSQWITERYNPATGTWALGENMPVGRTFHRAVPLPSGKVLVLGGTDSATFDVGYAATAVYDPLTRSWSAAGGMAVGRFHCSATSLPDGRVLAAGGTVRAGLANPGYGDDLLTATTEIFAE